MRRIWLYWLLIVLVITYFSTGIVRAAEYKFHVITDTGTYKVFKAQWWEVQEEYNRRVPQHIGLIVSGFSDLKRKEIWYSEDVLNRAIVRIPGLRRLWKHPLEVELEHVSSHGCFVRAFIQNKEDVTRINVPPIINGNEERIIR